MSWEEFVERYTVYCEEFCFKYRDYVFTLNYSPDGTQFMCYVSLYTEQRTLLQWIRNRGEYIECKAFPSPQSLLEGFVFDGKHLKTLWMELEWR